MCSNTQLVYKQLCYSHFGEKLSIYREDRSHVGHSEIACATTYYPLILISRMDPLKSLFEKPALTGRTTKWQMLLSESDIKFMTRKAIKGQAVAESPLPAYEPMQLEFSLLSVFLNYIMSSFGNLTYN